LLPFSQGYWRIPASWQSFFSTPCPAREKKLKSLDIHCENPDIIAFTHKFTGDLISRWPGADSSSISWIWLTEDLPGIEQSRPPSAESAASAQTRPSHPPDTDLDVYPASGNQLIPKTPLMV
jgi:hypothetical protein